MKALRTLFKIAMLFVVFFAGVIGTLIFVLVIRDDYGNATYVFQDYPGLYFDMMPNDVYMGAEVRAAKFNYTRDSVLIYILSKYKDNKEMLKDGFYPQPRYNFDECIYSRIVVTGDYYFIPTYPHDDHINKNGCGRSVSRGFYVHGNTGIVYDVSILLNYQDHSFTWPIRALNSAYHFDLSILNDYSSEQITKIDDSFDLSHYKNAKCPHRYTGPKNSYVFPLDKTRLIYTDTSVSNIISH